MATTRVGCADFGGEGGGEGGRERGVLRMDNISMLSLTAVVVGMKLNFLIMFNFIHARGLA